MLTDNLIKLIERQAALAGGLSLQLVQLLTRLWTPYRNWTDYDLLIAQAARSATTVEAATRQTRMRQRAYMKLVYKEMQIPFPKDEDIIRLDGIEGDVEIYERGVSPLEVYQRPAEEMRYHLSTGTPYRQSLGLAIDRLSTIAETDLLLARREEMADIYEATPEVTGWRRIIHPELSKTGQSCGLCVVASQRVYNKGTLMPIHDECNCDTLPITEGNDPGLELNEDDLKELYAAAGSNAAGDLLSTKVSFTDHGELGPIISTGNRQGSKQRKRAKAQKVTPAESIDNQLHVLRKSSEKLAKRLANGEDVALSLNWQRDRISVLETRQAALKRRK